MAAKENFKSFCSQTGLHGFAYTVSGRNHLETAFWVLIVITAVIWATVNCYNSFIDFQVSPVILTVETFKYDASKVPFPTITFCPEQKLDELNMASILLNRLKFRCRANDYALDDLEMCEENDLQLIRKQGSPFYNFLNRLDDFVNAAVDKIGIYKSATLKR